MFYGVRSMINLNTGNYSQYSLYGAPGATSSYQGAGQALGSASTESGFSVDQVKGSGECETCKNRKYVDGSDEMVSYKSPTHISAGGSVGAVMAHESEHVANAYGKASSDGGEVISATVSIRMATCPECGASYAEGGTTRTTIRYSNDSNPYTQNQKSLDAASLVGSNLDYAV